MACDWIKWCKGFGRKPEVIQMADRLQLPRQHIATAFMELAEWLDSEGIPDNPTDPDSDITVTILSRSERDKRITLLSHIDDISRTLGFGNALEEVRWVEYGDGWIRFKRAARHNSETAKKRALAARRQQKKRAQSAGANGSELCHAASVTREEKNIYTPIVPKKRSRKRNVDRGYSDDFNRFWSVYPKLGRVKKPDAWAAWSDAVLRADPRIILAAILKYAASELGQSNFAGHAATWLRADRWEEDPESWRRREGKLFDDPDTAYARRQFAEPKKDHAHG